MHFQKKEWFQIYVLWQSRGLYLSGLVVDRSGHVGDVVLKGLSLSILGHVVEVVHVGLVVTIVVAVESGLADHRLKILLAVRERGKSEGSRGEGAGDHGGLSSSSDKAGKHLDL